MVEKPNVIAIVEDDPSVRDALDLMLSFLGFQTELYASAEEFISAARMSEATCLLVDIQLGDISGVEMAHQLCAIGCYFPIIFMTGSHDEILQRQAMETGCVAFLHKPFPEDQLVESIKKATGSIPDRLLN